MLKTWNWSAFERCSHLLRGFPIWVAKSCSDHVPKWLMKCISHQERQDSCLRFPAGNKNSTQVTLLDYKWRRKRCNQSTEDSTGFVQNLKKSLTMFNSSLDRLRRTGYHTGERAANRPSAAIWTTATFINERRRPTSYADGKASKSFLAYCWQFLVSYNCCIEKKKLN